MKKKNRICCAHRDPQRLERLVSSVTTTIVP